MKFADLTPRDQAAVRAFCYSISPGDHDRDEAELVREVADWQEGDAMLNAIRAVIASADSTRAEDPRIAEMAERLRTTAQVLIAAVGADSPCNAEDAATRAVERIAEMQDFAKHVAGLWEISDDTAFNSEFTSIVRRASALAGKR